MNEIYLIGLGNPGKKYSKNRHNIGFLLVEKLSKKHILCLLFEYFLPGFPNPIKYISFMMYFSIFFVENYKYTNKL